MRVSKLPIHYFSPTTIERIGNHIGCTIRLDLETKKGPRACYARVCVDVDLTKPLLGKYTLEERIMLIKYESLDNICFFCEMYDHKDIMCPLSAPDDAVTTPEHTKKKEDEGDSGSWMTVTRSNRKGDVKPKSSHALENPQGSRFTILSYDNSTGPKQGVTSKSGVPPRLESPA
ncbi:hypothetical protein LINPERHAP1_LOCUS28710 [Linum perenne]